ncbi:MAG: DUF5996 family protein [Acidobacteriaceae bacterium]
MAENISHPDAYLWPDLPLAAWQPTFDTLHMWMQMVGKVCLELSPRINQWWETTFYVTATGLTTSAIPYAGGIFEIQFDFLHHKLLIETSRGDTASLDLRPRSVADFYREFMATLASLGIEVAMWTMPVEFPNPIPFDRDTQHASYDPEYANRFWRILVSCNTIFQEFRARFIGKASPSHFFWGSSDLAITRFSGRRAPEREGADAATREAYSHELISAGWWPGGGDIAGPAFYAYAAPEPAGFAQHPVQPAQAFYHPQLKEFLLMYDDVRQSPSPRATLLAFLESTYAAGATLGGWNRHELEREPTGNTPTLATTKPRSAR